MAYRATTRIEPTEEQFKELFDLNMNGFGNIKHILTTTLN